MIKQEQIDLLVERLVNRTNKANEYILRKMGKSIAEIKKLNYTEAQRLVNILKYGGTYDDIIQKLSEYTNLDIQDIDDIFRVFSKEDQSFYKQFYQYRDIPYVPYEENYALRNQSEALANIAENEMYNYTRSNVLGYSIANADGTVRFSGLRETYNTLLDNALLNIAQGTATFDEGMSGILNQIGTSGLKTIQYQSGRIMRLDSAIRMHLNGRLAELHNENQKIFGSEFDFDGWEISVHGYPAPDHQEVQGRQFSIEEFDKLQAEGMAKDYKGKEVSMIHVSKKGNVSHRPIGEMNCYHYAFPIVLGVSEAEYTDEQLEEINDTANEKFEFDGKQYSMYEATQLQRALERRVREQKDIQILAKESGNQALLSKSQDKIKILTDKYKELSQVSTLPTKMSRMKVSGYKRTNKEKVINRDDYKSYNVKAPMLDYPKYAKDFDFPSNQSLERYVLQGGNMFKRMQEDNNYKKEMMDIAKDIDKLKRPVKENIILYSGQDINMDLSKSKFVISTSIGKPTASVYTKYMSKNSDNMEVIKIYTEKGANVISTANISTGHFSRQGEIVIPISEIKNLKRINSKEYILKASKK